VRRLFLLVATVIFVDTAFYAAIVPLLPDYKEELDLSKAEAGVLTASYAAGTLAGSIPGGWLAARVGVKPTLLTGLGTLAVTSFAFGFADSLVLLDLARFVQGIGGACTWAAGMAWLIQAAPADRRGELIGSALAAAIVGVLFGPVIGGAATVVGPEIVFSSAALLAAGLALWAWTTPGVEPTRGPVFAPLAGALRSLPVVAAFWLFCLPAVFAGTLEVLVPLRMDELGASGVAVGAAFLVAAGVEAMVSPLAGRYSDRRGRMAPIRAGLIGAVGCAVLLMLPDTAFLVAAMLVLVIAVLGIFWAPAMAMLSDTSEATGLDQGLAFALANLAWAGGHVIGGAGAGTLADIGSDGLVYALIGGLCAVTLAGVLGRDRRADPEPAASGAVGPG
jgi:MFS family permease